MNDSEKKLIELEFLTDQIQCPACDHSFDNTNGIRKEKLVKAWNSTFINEPNAHLRIEFETFCKELGIE